MSLLPHGILYPEYSGIKKDCTFFQAEYHAASPFFHEDDFMHTISRMNMTGQSGKIKIFHQVRHCSIIARGIPQPPTTMASLTGR
jgi:hypothetical protein